jgi:hypothetical protein
LQTRTCASTVEVGVAVVAGGAVTAVPGAVGGVNALAERAPAREVEQCIAQNSRPYCDGRHTDMQPRADGRPGMARGCSSIFRIGGEASAV